MIGEKNVSAAWRAGSSHRSLLEVLATDLPSSSTDSAPPTPSFPTRQVLFLVGAAACLFFAGLGRLPLLEPDEGRNAEVAREMLVSGDWVRPQFNGLPYLDKPAVFFWMVAASFRLWGVSEWAARFPSALMALATVLLTWFLGRRMFGDSTGFRSGIILATTPLVLAFSRQVIFDMALTFLVTVAMASYWFAEAGAFRRPWLDATFFAAMGVATITKGPVGFLLPLLSVLAYQAASGRIRELKRLRWGLGLMIFLAAALPWFIAVTIRHPEFPGYAFWEESLLRFATGHAQRTGGPFYYLPVFLAGFFPWSFFLVFAGGNRLKKWRELRQEDHRPVLFLLAWAGVIFVFFTVSQSKLPGYFLPATVPLSILMAQVWGEVKSEAASPVPGAARASAHPDWLTAGFAAMIAVGLLVAVAPQMFRFTGVEVRMARKLSPAVTGFLKPSLLYTGLILVALGIIGRNLASRAREKILSRTAFLLLALTVPLLVVRWFAPLSTYAATSSSRQLAERILASPEKELPLYGYYCFRTSLTFYLRRPVGVVTEDASEMTSNYVTWRFQKLRHKSMPDIASTSARDAPQAPPAAVEAHEVYRFFIDALELQAKSRRSTEAFLVLVRNRDVGKLAQTVDRMDPLWTGWEYSVWKIPPAKH